MKLIPFFLILLLFINPASARTRQASVENFIDSLRLSVDGYANTVGGEVNITSSTEALELSFLLNDEVNNSLDILLFFQKSQNETGGFASIPDRPATWGATVSAVRGLQHLEVNQTQIQNWTVFNYLNKTAMNMLYINNTVGNNTSFVPRNLTLSLIDTWYEYIQTSFFLGFPPTADYQFLVESLQTYQYSNGSYADFEHATKVIHLLSIMNQQPADPDLASKYIRAYIQISGAFSNIQEGEPSLIATYLGIRALNELNAINKLEYKDAMVRFILGLQYTNSGFGEVKSPPTLYHSWLAVNTLFMMEKLHELNSPDVLQTEGFISWPSIFIPMTIIAIITRRKHNG